MPTLPVPQLANSLVTRVQTELADADTSADGHVDAAERAGLPADVRPLADNTADAYLAGGPLPIDAYADAYRGFVTSALEGADADGSGTLSEDEQAALPASVFGSVAALRAVTTPSGPAADLESMYQDLSTDGWTDDKVMEFIGEAQRQGKVNAFADKLWTAVLNPAAASTAHAGARFYEALSWYTDKTVGSSDGQLTLAELQQAMSHKAQEYFSHAGDPSAADARRQAFKFIQKLHLLKNEIAATGGDSYAYDAAAMGSVNHANAWNAAHTLDSAAEFQSKVIDASYDKPVLVKYGLTYCVHCLLLEHLDSVHAVADKYEDDLDVYKLWWNPNDPAMAEISDVARDQGVSSSPFFIVYDKGEAVRAAYAFPDENGDGMEGLLNGVI